MIKSFLSRKSKLGGLTEIDSLALIGSLGHNPDIEYPGYSQLKEWAGDVTIHTQEETPYRQFARREKISEIIIPFGNLEDIVEYIDVNFTNEYEVTYFSVVPVSYYGYTQTALELVSAEQSEVGDISSQLAEIDYNYAYLDSTCIITLQFHDGTTPEEGYVRDYVVQYDGHYTVPAEDRYALNKNNALKHLVSKTQSAYSFKLHMNYPNPFNPKTAIKYSIPADANTKLTVFNMLGQLVITLVDTYQKAGEYEVNFNGENLPSGVYFYRLESGSRVDTKKMVLVK